MKITGLFLTLIISVTFFSCKKESPNDPDPTPKVKIYIEDYTSGSTHSIYTFNLNYDNKGRLVSMVSAASQGDRFEYSYQSGSVTMDLFNSNTLSIHEMFFLNNNSQVDSTFQYNDTQDSTSERYIYNGSKQLIKLIIYDYSKAVSTIDDITNYTYDASGNVITEVSSYSHTTYEYYPDLSANINLGLYLVQPTKNLIKTATISDGYDTQVLNHTYTFDTNNRLSSEKIMSDNGEIGIKTYTY